MGLLKYVALNVLMLVGFCVYAQNKDVINYNQDNGLDATTTYRMAQDKKGFIWIGSDNGLFRFDGTSFKQYAREEGLLNIDVLNSFPMEDGTILISPLQNDFAVMKKGHIITSHENKELSKPTIDNRPRIIVIPNDSNTKMCLIEKLNPVKMAIYAAGRIDTIPLYADYPKLKGSFSIAGYDFINNLYLANGWDIYCYDIALRKTTRLDMHDPGKLSGMRDPACKLFCRFEDSMLDIYNIQKREHKKVFVKDEIYWALKSGSYLWVSLLNGGVVSFDLENDPGLKDPHLIMPGYVINDVICDRDKNIWLSGKGSGVFFIPRESFKHYSTWGRDSTRNITAMAANADAVFLGYGNGEGGIYKNATTREIHFGAGRTFECRGIFAGNEYAVFGFAKGAFRVDLRNFHIEELDKNGNKNAIKNIAPYTKESVLFCNNSELIEYNFKKDTSAIHTGNIVFTALPYAPDSFFTGSFKDLYKYNIATGGKKLFLAGYYFTDLKQVAANRFAGATNGYGIVVFDRRGVLLQVSKNNGLPSNQVKNLTVQDPSTIWAATNMGLCRVHFDGTALKINTFTRLDGLPSDRVSGCVIRNDTIYVGTSGGLAVFDLKKLLDQDQYLDTKAIINSVAIGSKEYFEPDSTIITTYPDNNISIDLSFPDYTSQGKVSYRYKIEGLNSSWQVTTSSRINLNAIPPGVYTIKIFGLGYNGKRSKEFTSLQFEVRPKYWQTWWFKVIIGGLFLLIVFGAAVYFIQKRKEKKMKELDYDKKIAELELQAVKAQINPHFVYNCLNSIKYLLYKKDYSETENYLRVFTQMIRTTLHYSETTFTTIKEEQEYLMLYMDMEKLRFKDHFEYSILIGKTVDTSWKIPSLLIQPFVENAIKHGIDTTSLKKGIVTISFEYSAPTLIITINDNGKGLKNSTDLAKPESFGIKLTQKRIDTFRQLFNMHISMEIYDLSETGGQGTGIKFCLNI